MKVEFLQVFSEQRALFSPHLGAASVTLIWKRDLRLALQKEAEAGPSIVSVRLVPPPPTSEEERLLQQRRGSGDELMLNRKLRHARLYDIYLSR